VFFTGGRAGIDFAVRLPEETQRIAFVNRNENAFVEQSIAFGIEQDEIGGAEGFAGQHDRLGIGDRRIRDLGIADDDLGNRPILRTFA
jgi:hypothetical protein